MSVLYKYCDQLGAVKILGSLELKMPNIIDVNDPLECKPVFCQGNDSDKDTQCPQNKQEEVQRCSQRHLFKNDLDTAYCRWEESRQGSYLISVSGCCNKSVMWAHYADKHKGVAIGIDFNEIIIPFYEVIPKKVNYSDFRVKIDVLAPGFLECFQQAMYSKSKDWAYENEFRYVCFDFVLKKWEEKGFVRFGFSGERKACFLRLKPQCIKEIIWGLHTEEAIKVTVRKLVSCLDLQHIKLYQVKESDGCDFDVIDPETGLIVR